MGFRIAVYFILLKRLKQERLSNKEVKMNYLISRRKAA